MSAAVQRVLSALEALGRVPRRCGASWMAQCPAHEDRHPSLSLSEGSDGKALLKCHAGCDLASILAGLGLEQSALFEARETASRETRYPIRDAAGNLVATHVRLDRTIGKRMWWERHGMKGLSGLPVASLPLYRAELVKAIPEGAPVFVVEGEKAADALRERGFHVVATVCGAAACPDATVLTVLSGRDAVLWPDANDDRDEGVRHMRRVGVGLDGIARTVRVFEWRNAPAHGDAFDYFAAGRSAESLRAELQHAIGFAEWRAAGSAPPADKSSQSSPWSAAVDVHDFVSSSEPDSDWLVPNMIARGSVTAWFSPRGIGKTLIAHSFAVELARQGMRVLLIDRDNPRREVRRRLRSWGLDRVERGRFRVIARDQAPPLTDAGAWRSFPVGEYDLVILDSFDSATEGIGEGDSSKPSVAVAALLDVVRGTKGPAALVLGNTIKSGSHARGSGVVEDRLDIVFEVRDATGLTPSGTKDWWLELPAAGREAWAERSARRKRRDSYRLAFVPSKFRIGEEPDPFAYGVQCAGEPWTCADVTSELVREGQEARDQAQSAKQVSGEQAADALKALVIARHAAGSPIQARHEAEPFLTERGLSREAARKVIADRDGRDWSVRGRGARGEPYVLVPLGPPPEEGAARNGRTPEPCGLRPETDTIVADQEPSARPESTLTGAAPDAPETDGDFRPTAGPGGAFREYGEDGDDDRRRREAAILRALGGAE
jgi:hypothetical protein